MRLRVKLVLTLFLIPLVITHGFAQNSFQPVTFTVNSFVINGDNPIGDKAQQLLQPYLGEQYGLEGLSAAADALEQAIISAGYSFHRVSLPPQQLTSGSVEFRVVRFEIGAVNISDNQFFDNENIQQSLPHLRSQSTPNTKELSRQLKLANNHASKNITVKFKEGEMENTIDAQLTVQDSNPQLFFVTLDNTGTKETKEIRSTLGYQHGNLFNKDHAVTATLTVAPEDPSATTQIGLNYHIPLYDFGSNLDFLFSDSEVNSGETGSANEVTGKGTVIGASYSRPLLSGTSFDHQWSAGFQFKSFDNETPLGEEPVDSFPLTLGYLFSYNGMASVLSGGLNFASNIDSGSNNSDENYFTSSFGRVDSNSWSALRYNLSFDQVFAESWLFHAGMSGQYSDDLLISGEQFGVGGSKSLRGFEERTVTGDRGYQTSVEIWTPVYAGSRFLMFVDQASVEDLFSDVTYDLLSAGLGLRWSWKQQLSVSMDFGVILKGLETDEGINTGTDDPINLEDDSKAHFNLVYRF